MSWYDSWISESKTCQSWWNQSGNPSSFSKASPSLNLRTTVPNLTRPLNIASVK